MITLGLTTKDFLLENVTMFVFLLFVSSIVQINLEKFGSHTFADITNSLH